MKCFSNEVRKFDDFPIPVKWQWNGRCRRYRSLTNGYWLCVNANADITNDFVKIASLWHILTVGPVHFFFSIKIKFHDSFSGACALLHERACIQTDRHKCIYKFEKKKKWKKNIHDVHNTCVSFFVEFACSQRYSVWAKLIVQSNVESAEQRQNKIIRMENRYYRSYGMFSLWQRLIGHTIDRYAVRINNWNGNTKRIIYSIQKNECNKCKINPASCE